MPAVRLLSTSSGYSLAVLSNFAKNYRKSWHTSPELFSVSHGFDPLEDPVVKSFFTLSLLSSLFLAVPAVAQYGPPPQFDVGFGVGTVLAPSSNSASGDHSPQTIGGGAYLNFSGDYLFWRHVGVEGEVAWRATQNLYGGYQPFRPIFYAVNGIYAPNLGPHFQLELLGGIGASKQPLLLPDLLLRLLHLQQLRQQ